MFDYIKDNLGGIVIVVIGVVVATAVAIPLTEKLTAKAKEVTQ